MTGGQAIDRPRLVGRRLPDARGRPEHPLRHPRRRAGSAGSDTMVITSGAPHPIAANLWINFNLDAQVSAAEHELHRLHGPERGGQGVHQPGRSWPTRRSTRTVALLDKLVELLDLGADADKYTAALERAEGLTEATARRATTRRPRGPAGRRQRDRRLAGRLGRAGSRRSARRPRRARRGLARRCSSSSRWRSSSSSASGRGTADRSRRSSTTSGFRTTPRRPDPEYLPAFANSLRYAAITTVLSIVIGYPIAYWISTLRRAPQDPAPDPGDAPVLDQLPHPDVRLDDHPPRQRGPQRRSSRRSGLIDEPLVLLNTDVSVILGMTYGFLPFAILPLFVSIDRLDQQPRPGGARPVRQRSRRVPARDPAADDARRSSPPRS